MNRFVALLAVAACVAAVEFDTRVTTDMRGVQHLSATFRYFGFLEGGSLRAEMHINAPQTATWLAVCLPKDRTYLIWDQTACDRGWVPQCTFYLLLPQNTTDVNFTRTVTMAGYYESFFVSCGGDAIDITVHGWYVNPGGEQLSADDIPLKWLYAVLGALWLAYTVAWIANWIRFRHQRNSLHRAITVFPVVEFVWSILCTALFFSLSLNGQMSELTGFVIAYYILLPFEDVAIFGIILLVSHGWGISKPHLDGRFVVYFIVCLAGLLVTEVCGLWLSGLFSLLVFIFYCIIVYFALININRNIHEYRQTVNQVAPSGNPTSRDHLKFQMFWHYRIIITAFIVLMFVVNILEATLSSSNNLWVSELMRQALFLALFSAIAITFRLRSSNIYYRLDDEDDGTNVIHVAPSLETVDVRPPSPKKDGAVECKENDA